MIIPGVWDNRRDGIVTQEAAGRFGFLSSGTGRSCSFSQSLGFCTGQGPGGPLVRDQAVF